MIDSCSDHRSAFDVVGRVDENNIPERSIFDSL